MKAKLFTEQTSFGGGSHSNINHLTDGKNTIVGGVYIMIKESDFDSLKEQEVILDFQT